MVATIYYPANRFVTFLHCFFYSSRLPVTTFFLLISYPFSLGHFSPSAKFYPCTTIARSCQCRFGKNFFELLLTLESGKLPGSFCFVKKLFIRSLTTYFLPSNSTNWTFNCGSADLPKGEKLTSKEDRK